MAALPEDWVGALLALERLDEAWTHLLEGVPAALPEAPADWEIPLEQLLCYFLYRHLPGALGMAAGDGFHQSRTGKNQAQ